MNTTIASLQLHIDNIIKYLNPHFPLMNCHMVNYLTDNLWMELIPSDIRTEIRTKSDIQNAINIFWKENSSHQQFEHKNHSFHSFLRNSEKYRIDSLTDAWLTSDKLATHWRANGCLGSNYEGIRIKEFMNEKKNHEVEIAANLVANLCTYGVGNGNKRLSVIDAGDGKGYLSSRLALEYDLRILGIDSNKVNTENALKRQSKLEVGIIQ